MTAARGTSGTSSTSAASGAGGAVQAVWWILAGLTVSWQSPGHVSVIGRQMAAGM
ncbi:hypothetical protein ATKI12_0240 [Kitasatospora sp. Ki12]